MIRKVIHALAAALNLAIIVGMGQLYFKDGGFYLDPIPVRTPTPLETLLFMATLTFVSLASAVVALNSALKETQG